MIVITSLNNPLRIFYLTLHLLPFLLLLTSGGRIKMYELMSMPIPQTLYAEKVMRENTCICLRQFLVFKESYVLLIFIILRFYSWFRCEPKKAESSKKSGP